MPSVPFTIPNTPGSFQELGISPTSVEALSERKQLRVLADVLLAQPASSTIGWFCVSAVSRDIEMFCEPLMERARWKSPLHFGDIINAITEVPPEDWPAMVTRLGSPSIGRGTEREGERHVDAVVSILLASSTMKD
jgi:hypothetical protein